MTNLTGIEKWRALDGDNTLALDWPLDENSHVWEIGGFEGRWVQQIWDKFHCNITVFEPQLWAIEKLNNRFGRIGKIEVRNYGLWTENGVFPIGDYGNDGASLLKGLHSTDVALFKNILTEIDDFDHSIDLALMNIEGAEYTLIPRIVEFNLMGKFNYFWCQFHTQFSNPKIVQPEKESVFIDQYYFDLIGQTHDLLWDCYPTAVAWKRR